MKIEKIDFIKMVASGNDFVIAELKAQNAKLKALARQICDRKYGIGADGLLVLGKSKVADIKMRIFNPDGSEPSMCGNGARCVALWKSQKHRLPSVKLNIETKAGIIEAVVNDKNVKIKLTGPKNLKLDISLKINNRTLRVNFINTGVPHTVIFVEGLDKIDVQNFGRTIRYHKRFAPQGTNVDFVEVLNKNSIQIRTYERGVEDETLACGTGIVASALITGYKLGVIGYREMNVQTKGKETLRVYFARIKDSFRDVWLEGKAKIICKGVYYV